MFPLRSGQQGLSGAGGLVDLVASHQAQGRAFGSGSDHEGGQESLRQGVVDFLTARPGATIIEVAQALSCSHTTASYHLMGLVREGAVSRRKEGRVVRHYGVGMDTVVARLKLFLEDPRSARVVQKLATAPMWPLNQLAKAASVNHGYVVRTLNGLAAHGFAELVRPRARFYAKASDLLLKCMPAQIALAGYTAPTEPVEAPLAEPVLSGFHQGRP